MNHHDIALGRESAPCTGCRAEVPLSEALVAEAVDYVVHFCGLACYAEWAAQRSPGECSAGSVVTTARERAMPGR